MKVVLHIKRASGSTERHELPADGDYVEVPYGLLSAEDVLGFDVEISGPDRCGFDLEVTSRAAGVREVFD